MKEFKKIIEEAEKMGIKTSEKDLFEIKWSEKKSIKTINFLKEKGIKENQIMIWASKHDCLEIIKQLVEKGVKIQEDNNLVFLYANSKPLILKYLENNIKENIRRQNERI